MSRRASKRAATRQSKKARSERPAPLEQRAEANAPVENVDASPALVEVEVEVEEEAEMLRSSALELLPSRPPPPPIPSGIAPSGARAREQQPDELAEFLVGLRPYYRESERKSERAPALEVEDLSLRFDNPYIHSSLVPPPEPPRWQSKSVLLSLIGSVGAVVIIGGATLLFSRDRAPTNAEAPSMPVSVAAAAPLVGAALAAAAAPAQPTDAVSELTSGVAREPEVAPPPPRVEAPAPAPVAEPAVEPAHASAAAARAPQRLVSARPLVARAAAVAPSPSPVAPRAAAPTETLAPKTVNPAPGVAQAAAAAPSAWPAAPAAAAPAPVPAAETPSEAPPSGPLPRLPPPKAVKASFEKIHAPLSACALGKHGLVTIHATVNNEGRIVSAFVDGVFKSAEEQSCMARAILTLRLPPFSQSTFKVSYPLAL